MRFLHHRLRPITGQRWVVWDGAPLHRCQAVKDVLAAVAAARLRLEQVPGYAPDLNPEEGVWRRLK